MLKTFVRSGVVAVLVLPKNGPASMARRLYFTSRQPIIDLLPLRLYIRSMSDFDPNKDAINRQRHGISLERWVDVDIEMTVIDDRYDYGEVRYRSYGWIEREAYCFVYTIRDGRYRPISLRRVHAKEMKKYVS